MPPRRRKRPGQAAARTPSGGLRRPAWQVFSGGFIAGLLCCVVALYLYQNGLETNFGSGIRNLLDGRSATGPAPEGDAAGAASDPRPVFDFYTVLPEYETVIDEKQYLRESREAKPAVEEKVAYVLQAASYGSFNDADRLKAKLALNGLVAKIEKVSVAGKGDFYRVRLGPYSSARTMQDVNRRLQSLGIKPLHLKVSASGN